MENFNADWNAQQEDAHESKKPVSPFADSPYESAYSEKPVPITEKKAKGTGKRLLSVVLVIALIALACGATAVGVSVYWNQKMQVFDDVMEDKLEVLQDKISALQGGNAGSATIPTVEGALTPGAVYAQNVQAVVAISNQALTTNIYGQVSQTASSGSGFIISENGYVVSNYHVVEGASKLSVLTSDGKEYDAQLVGYDAANDLSVLKIEGEGFPYVKMGSSDALSVGDQVMAIGNPLGELTSTLTVGYVSAKDREVNTDGTYLNMLQTDAAINSGNSGGPLFNSYGEVVGITTAKYSGTSNSGATIEGIGFAIPIDDVAGMIQDLMKQGYVSGAYLGVMVRDMDSAVSQAYGLPMGVYVDEVTKGSCADVAGVQAKDIIIGLAGQKIESMSQLTRVLRDLEPGDTTTITVYRSGAQLDMNITLDEKPHETQQEQPTQPNEQTVTPDQNNFSDWFNNFFPGFGG